MKTSTNYWIRPLIKTARSYISFANLPYCNIDAIEVLACPLCSSILDGSFKVFNAHKFHEHGTDFKSVLIYSATNKEVIISFSGPKSTDYKFYEKLWTGGFTKFHDLSIESLYMTVYNKLGNHLKESLKKLEKEHPAVKDFKYIFVGHSFGGSLAVLAAYDLITNKAINTHEPIVYTYGQLRIGDAEFVGKVNETVKVVRIIKDNDYMTRAPHCIPSEANSWNCYSTDKLLMEKAPEYRDYIMHNVNGRATPGPVVAWNSSDPRRSSFLEKKGIFYSHNNPGIGVNTWGFGLTNQEDGMYYSQPIGAEVLFSSTFDRHRVCQYFNGIPNCERTLPQRFNPDDHAEYFGTNLEIC
jgi:hypothetical protein